jgi:hypothetical protein
MILRKCQLAGAAVGAALPVAAYALAQLGGTAPLTLGIALMVFWPVLWILGAVGDSSPMKPFDLASLMFGSVGLYMAIGWIVGAIVGWLRDAQKSPKSQNMQ